jgi:fatty acid desaturase
LNLATNLAEVEPPGAQPDLHGAVAPPGQTALRGDADARRYVRVTLWHTLGLYGVLAAALSGWLPAWVLVPVVPWLYIRLSLSLHELLHVRDAAEVPAFHRLAMIFDTPFGLGYREHRAIHLRHHQFGGGDRDPELYQIAGGHLRALGNALATPERALLGWIRVRGLDASLARAACFRLACFVAIAIVDPTVFLVYWLVLRASIGGAGFVFHHQLHNRGGRLGTYALPWPAGLVRIGRVIFGDEPMQILTQHRSHHLWPAVRVGDLPTLSATFSLPPGPVSTATMARACQECRR